MSRPVVTVCGRRWFNARPGNTYHSVVVWVDGELVGVAPFEYGYGEQYLETARALLGDWLPAESGWRRLDRAIAEAGGVLVSDVVDVARMRDLHWGGKAGRS